jgi:hypothetical protein
MIDMLESSEPSRRRSRAYGFGFRAVSSDPRPLVAIDIDGVIALDNPPEVAATLHEVTAWGMWRREVRIAVGTAEMIHQLADRCEVAWATAWSYNARARRLTPSARPFLGGGPATRSRSRFHRSS